MHNQNSNQMQSFVDKLVDHLPSQRIKLLIDNGFDEWDTISYMKGQQLIDLGFDTQECIIIMVAANSNATQNGQTEIFAQQRMQQIIARAKQNDQVTHQKILKQQSELHKKSQQSQNSQPPPSSSHHLIKQPQKQITQSLLIKGCFMKPKQGQKIQLNKATMINLEQKQITNITNLDKCSGLVNLHLGNNYIYRIQGLGQLVKLRVLKLEHNNISRIQGFQNLVNLEHLYLSSNYINRLQNLTNNQKLQQLYISKQKIQSPFTFDSATTQALAYTLQKLECKQNKIKNITNLKYLKVVKDVNLEKNQLDDVGQLSETISGMESLKTLNFKDCPLTKAQKYRDYIVILSKTLQQLDGKKILAKQRQYLVKLYALKHAKQSNDQKPKQQQKSSKNMDLHGVKMQQQFSNYANINRATDLRGNVPYSNTKHVNR